MPSSAVMLWVGAFVYILLFCGGLFWGSRAQDKHARFWSGTLASSGSVEEASSDVKEYWLTNVNKLRSQKNLRQLKIDSRLTQTAETWAKEMEGRGEITHTRLDGKTMHQWIDEKNLPFTKYGSENGWKSNYFVENIARYYAEPTGAGLNEALDKILAEYLSEGPGGDHYESLYHPDWNTVGVGYAFKPVENGSARVYFVFHYGSLEP